VSLRSEWDLSEEDWRGDLACSHEQHEGSGAHRSTIRRQMIDFVFSLHRAIESASCAQRRGGGGGGRGGARLIRKLWHPSLQR
jgi:hypothetical protein